MRQGERSRRKQPEALPPSLAQVYAQSTGASTAAIAQALGLKQGTLMVYVRQLRDRGLLRVVVPDDARPSDSRHWRLFQVEARAA